MTQGKIRRGSKQLLTPFANCLHFEDQAICTFCLLQYQVSYQFTQNLLLVYLKNLDGANRKIAIVAKIPIKFLFDKRDL